MSSTATQVLRQLDCIRSSTHVPPVYRPRIGVICFLTLSQLYMLQKGDLRQEVAGFEKDFSVEHIRPGELAATLCT